jgi:hypothetical protein
MILKTKEPVDTGSFVWTQPSAASWLPWKGARRDFRKV